MYRARHLVGRAHRRAQHLDGNLVWQAEQQNGAGVFRRRQHLEGDLGHDRQCAPAAGNAAAEVDARDVLHDPAARLEDVAATVYAPQAK